MKTKNLLFGAILFSLPLAAGAQEIPSEAILNLQTKMVKQNKEMIKYQQIFDESTKQVVEAKSSFEKSKERYDKRKEEFDKADEELIRNKASYEAVRVQIADSEEGVKKAKEILIQLDEKVKQIQAANK